MASEKEEVKKESGNIPEEHVLKNKEFSIDEWRKMKIDEALKFQQERETGADVPNWWEGTVDDKYFSPKYGFWQNCIATATGAFGKKYCETGNKSFINPNSNGYFEKKGFREVTDDDKDEYGDIWIDYDGESPYHAIMLTGHDENGKPLFTYGTGYNNNINKGTHYPTETIKKKYRFVGTPEDIAEIEAHNAKVRKFHEETAPLREKREITRIPTKSIEAEPINTAKWLSTLPKRN